MRPNLEFVIGGYRPEGGTLELILAGYYDHGKFLFAGKVGSHPDPVVGMAGLADRSSGTLNYTGGSFGG